MISYKPIIFITIIYIYILAFSIFPFSPDRLVFFLFLFGFSGPQPSGFHWNPWLFPLRSVFSCALLWLPAIVGDGGGQGEPGRNGDGGAVPSLLPRQRQKQAHPRQGHTQLPRPPPTPLWTYSLKDLKGLKAANCILEFPSGAFCELTMQETKNHRKT